MGNSRTRLRAAGVDVLPFQVLNHGPPPTSSAAILLETSNMICHLPNIIHQNVPFKNTKSEKQLIYEWIRVIPSPCCRHIFVPTFVILDLRSMYLYKQGPSRLLLLEHAMLYLDPLLLLLFQPAKIIEYLVLFGFLSFARVRCTLNTISLRGSFGVQCAERLHKHSLSLSLAK